MLTNNMYNLQSGPRLVAGKFKCLLLPLHPFCIPPFASLVFGRMIQEVAEKVPREENLTWLAVPVVNPHERAGGSDESL